MQIYELIFGILLVVILLGVAGYYGWRQVQALRGLRVADERSPEERRFNRRQAWRRLVNSALMAVFAILLACSPALEPSDPADWRAARVYGFYWIAMLLVLLVIVVLAALDLLAIRRYGLSQLLQIQTDRRAMIEEEVARLRRDRNGHA